MLLIDGCLLNLDWDIDKQIRPCSDAAEGGVWSGYALFAITKTRLYNVDPLQPHFYIAKVGFTGVYINFLISAQKHRLWVLVRTARRGGSNEYPQSMFWIEIWKKKILEFFSKNFHFLAVKFSIYLNRLVFVMLNCRKFRVKWNRPKSPFRTIFPAYTQRQPTHQCCQCFD